VDSVAVSPDGSLVATGADGVRLYDARTGALLRAIGDGWDQKGPGGRGVAFSPDGRTLAAAGFHRDKLVGIFDVQTGKRLQSLAGHTEWEIDALAFSPDGKLLAWSDRAGGLRVCDVDGGRTVHRPGGNAGAGASSLCFSPDGALLACGQNSLVVVWDTVTWKEVRRLGGHEGGVFDLAFTPDGRSLATGCYDTKVRLWEVATGEERCRFEGHRDRVYRIGISPDGRTVASGSADGEVLLWDVTGLATGRFRRAEPLSAAELEALWGELQSGDGARAYRAVCALAASPRQAVPFLKERLRPATVGTAQVGRLLADLDADDFAVREQATRDLAGLGKLAEPALRRALTDAASAEVRKRVEGLLDRLERGAPAPGFLLALRATETLEIVGSAEARELLQILAEGGPGAPLTQQAKASLERLARRAAASR
jgi:dipeptidyl aminopeptidase/acylaminoacyl peptidase